MKRKSFPFLLLLTGIVLGYFYFILSCLVGFMAAKYFSGKTAGTPGKVKSVIAPIGKYRLHLHHWLICLGAIVFGLVKGFYFLPPEILCGFLGGLAFQGIYCYSDWYRIFVSKPQRIDKPARENPCQELENCTPGRQNDLGGSYSGRDLTLI